MLLKKKITLLIHGLFVEKLMDVGNDKLIHTNIHVENLTVMESGGIGPHQYLLITKSSTEIMVRL